MSRLHFRGLERHATTRRCLMGKGCYMKDLPPTGLGWKWEIIIRSDAPSLAKLRLQCTGHSSIQWTRERVRMFNSAGIEITVGMYEENDKGCSGQAVFTAETIEEALLNARKAGWKQTGRENGWECPKHSAR